MRKRRHTEVKFPAQGHQPLSGRVGVPGVLASEFTLLIAVLFSSLTLREESFALKSLGEEARQVHDSPPSALGVTWPRGGHLEHRGDVRVSVIVLGYLLSWCPFILTPNWESLHIWKPCSLHCSDRISNQYVSFLSLFLHSFVLNSNTNTMRT